MSAERDTLSKTNSSARPLPLAITRISERSTQRNGMSYIGNEQNTASIFAQQKQSARQLLFINHRLPDTKRRLFSPRLITTC